MPLRHIFGVHACQPIRVAQAKSAIPITMKVAQTLLSEKRWLGVDKIVVVRIMFHFV